MTTAPTSPLWLKSCTMSRCQVPSNIVSQLQLFLWRGKQVFPKKSSSIIEESWVKEELGAAESSLADEAALAFWLWGRAGG